MPLKPIDYSKTIMYKIVCFDLNIKDCYVGHTTDYIRRKTQHKRRCNNINDKGYNYKLYQFIRENGGYENWDMIKIEDYNCNTKLDASKRERELIETLNATLNSQIPSRTMKEYNEVNLNNIKEYKKEWYEVNREIIKEKKKEYRNKNADKINEKIKCECGAIINKNCMARHRITQKHQIIINFLKDIPEPYELE